MKIIKNNTILKTFEFRNGSSPASKPKLICDRCGKKVRRLTKDKQGFLVCGSCKRNSYTRIGCFGGLTLEKALNRIYTIHKYKIKTSGKEYCVSHFPPVLGGMRFKVQLLDEPKPEKKENLIINPNNIQLNLKKEERTNEKTTNQKQL